MEAPPPSLEMMYNLMVNMEKNNSEKFQQMENSIAMIAAKNESKFSSPSQSGRTSPEVPLKKAAADNKVADAQGTPTARKLHDDFQERFANAPDLTL